MENNYVFYKPFWSFGYYWYSQYIIYKYYKKYRILISLRPSTSGFHKYEIWKWQKDKECWDLIKFLPNNNIRLAIKEANGII